MNNIVFSVQYSILRKQRHSCFDQDEDIFLLRERERERERESSFFIVQMNMTQIIYIVFFYECKFIPFSFVFSPPNNIFILEIYNYIW